LGGHNDAGMAEVVGFGVVGVGVGLETVELGAGAALVAGDGALAGASSLPLQPVSARSGAVIRVSVERFIGWSP